MRSFSTFFRRENSGSLQKSTWLVAAILSLISIQLCAQVTGTVFRDYNGNGTRDTYEPLVAGVTVTAYTSTGASCATYVSTDAASPNYILAACSGAVRVEFVLPGTSTTPLGAVSGVDFSSNSGSVYGSSVQFVTAPAANVNYALNYPGDYWDNSANPNPKLLITRMLAGSTSDSKDPGEPAVIQVDNAQSGANPVTANIATWSEVGALWGQGHQNSMDRFFFTALAKRHSGFGPKGPGGVYIVEPNSGTYDLAGSFSLEGVTPVVGSPIAFGNITRVSSPTTDDNYLTNATQQPFGGPDRDLDAYNKVGKTSFGDADYWAEGNLLFFVNLFQKTLITLDVSGTTASLNNASASALGPLTKSYDITTLPGIPSCSTGELRPWGLKLYRGAGYLGVVCDAGTSQDKNDLAGYVLKFDPSNISAGFTTVLTLDFNYRSNANIDWRAWTSDWSQTGLGATSGPIRAEPIIAEIEFNESGGIILIVNNRFGNQIGSGNYAPIPGSTVNMWGQSYGDILYACYDKASGVWTMEATGAGCPVTTAYGYTDEGYGDGYGGAAREFFNDASGDGSSENGMGGAAKLMGSNSLIATVLDPLPTGVAAAPIYFSTGGLHWFDNTTGDWTQWTRLYNPTEPATFGKASGLGDVEAGLAPAPIEIGNRVWMDTDDDGIQDADEMGLNGITVKLYKSGTQVGQTTTAGNGNFYFNNSNVTMNGATGILPEMAYDIRIDAADFPVGKALSLQTNIAGTGQADWSDNDATGSGGNAVISIITGKAGHNNHTYDFAFSACAPSACGATIIVKN